MPNRTKSNRSNQSNQNVQTMCLCLLDLWEGDETFASVDDPWGAAKPSFDTCNKTSACLKLFEKRKGACASILGVTVMTIPFTTIDDDASYIRIVTVGLLFVEEKKVE